MDAPTGFIGRSHEIQLALTLLERGAHVLINGPAGIGKRRLLRELQQRYHTRPTIWLNPGPAKALLLQLLADYHQQHGLQLPKQRLPQALRHRALRTCYLSWEQLAPSLNRWTQSELFHLARHSLQQHPSLLIVESLQLTPSAQQLLLQLAECSQLLAALDSGLRISQRLHWQFPAPQQLSLAPLNHDDCLALAECYLQHQSLQFQPPALRATFLQQLIPTSGGVPAALLGILQQAQQLSPLHSADLATLYHPAGVRYLCLAPLLLIGFALALAGRYIARGLDSEELYWLSGLGLALFLSLRTSTRLNLA